ncbi:MAG: hypothetical protein PHP37_04565 [Patescibacteria group bacterium]|nr:hypothetical protein [Patescibacteria group bacterium]
MNNNFVFYLSKISVQILLDIIYFPLWWYSVGLLRLLKNLGLFLQERWMVVGAGVWLKNIFVPMYGQRDFASRAISFFIRLVQIIFRFVVFLLFVIISFIALAVWILAPVAIIIVIFNKIF